MAFVAADDKKPLNNNNYNALEIMRLCPRDIHQQHLRIDLPMESGLLTPIQWQTVPFVLTAS